MIIRATYLQTHFLPSEHKVGGVSLLVEVGHEQVTCFGQWDVDSSDVGHFLAEA